MTLLLFRQPDRLSLPQSPMMNSASGVSPFRLTTIPDPLPDTRLTSACSKFCALAFQSRSAKIQRLAAGIVHIGTKLALHLRVGEDFRELVRREQQVDRVVAAAAVIGGGVALVAERRRDLVVAAAGVHVADIA